MRRRRGGYMLAELSVTMGLIATTFSVLGVALHSLYRVDRHIRTELQQVVYQQRLAARLRADAHQASAAEIAPLPGGGGSALRLSLPDGTRVEYRPAGAALIRERQGQQGAVLHHDAFELPGGVTAQWRLEPPERPTMIALWLTPSEQTVFRPGDARDPLRIDAALRLTPLELQVSLSEGAGHDD